jgi:hypothetical protein
MLNFAILFQDEFCDKECSGDASQKCGGYLTMNVYQTDVDKKVMEHHVFLTSLNNFIAIKNLTFIHIEGFF